MDDLGLPCIAADDFVRRFALRAKTLMWLLGAGASAAAGIPTAWDMIWEFKQKLFISQRRASPQTVADLSNPAVRSHIQDHIDASGRLPAVGAPDEYAALFEEAYPAEADRRAYLEAKMAGAKPSYGHLALGTLMRAQLTRLAWMTNFDTLLADACAKVYDGTGPLTCVALDAPDVAAQCIRDERWPIEIKLHGDFRSRRLKNTSDELREQDQRLRQIFVDSCRRFGVVVVGYSGRDESIMATLEAGLCSDDPFPAGLFGLHRGHDPPLDRVRDLLVRAQKAGVEAALVPIENFDEAMRDLLRLIPDIDTTVLDAFQVNRRRWTPAPKPSGSLGWPTVRLNALEMSRMPTVCRRVVCQIGGYSDVRAAVEKAGVNILVARTRAGVLVFGGDADVRAAFDPYGITTFDLHAIETKRLRDDTGERSLLRDALTCAIARAQDLQVLHRHNAALLAPTDPASETWTPLRALVGSVTGTLPSCPGLRWFEGIQARLDWADDRLWLLVEPRIVFTGLTDTTKDAAADFARERTVKRYNRPLNDLVMFWARLLANDGKDLRALNVTEGVDAVFGLSAETAFSRRVGA